MDVLIEMTHESLKDIGVSAYGHRHKILRGIKELGARVPDRRKTKGIIGLGITPTRGLIPLCFAIHQCMLRLTR